jgi:hypothetical protein
MPVCGDKIHDQIPTHCPHPYPPGLILIGALFYSVLWSPEGLEIVHLKAHLHDTTSCIRLSFWCMKMSANPTVHPVHPTVLPVHQFMAKFELWHLYKHLCQYMCQDLWILYIFTWVHYTNTEKSWLYD